MSIFFPDQRWSSEGEPELGIGIVKESGKGRVRIHFPGSGETRVYASENAPLRRVLFKSGDKIVDRNNNPMLIERVLEDGKLYTYIGLDRTLSEADLGNVSITNGADDRLLTGDVDNPERFALRRRTLQYDYNRRISPVNGFVGGRIDLIPHQLYIAHEVSARYAPRVLLSDQVGLGKTIEACLILHRLLLSGRIARALILVPESLVHQWFVEVFRRFNLWFHIYDEERCSAIEESAPEGNPFLDGQLIICSTAFLADSPKRSSQALSAKWDMLVVDEAHHLEWSEDIVSKEYSIVELLSRSAKGVLLLTATPEQLGSQSHFARLRLLDPERYSDYTAFKNEAEGQKEIAAIVEDLLAAKKLKNRDVEKLNSIFDKNIADVLAKGGVSERNNLIEDLLDQHGPGRVVFRNTRSAMKGFPKRFAHLAPLSVSDGQARWIKRFTEEFQADVSELAVTSETKFWFRNDPRVEWLMKKMKSLHPEKVLLICRSKEKVLELERALLPRVNFKIGIFHEDLTIVQRDRNAAWFSESEGARILLCSEIGSEGRNFQFSHHLVLFDLPLHPELLEQRIGRLDRIGQLEDIHIHVPFLSGSPQEVLVRWYQEGLNAFEENLEGGNRISQLFRNRILNTSLSLASPNAEKEIEAIIADTSDFQKELKATLADGRDRLLEMNSFRPDVAEKIVVQIRAEDSDATLEIYMNRVFEHFGIETEDLAPRTYLLHRPPTDSEVFATIPDGGISITFDRKRALSREDMAFLTWDHPMVSGAIDMVLSLGIGSASFGVYRSSGSPALLLEMIFILETGGAQSIYVDRFLPKTPLRVVVDHSGTDVSDKYPPEILEQKLIPGNMASLLENDALMESILPNMISAARAIADSLGAQERAKALQKMNLSLNHEIERLRSLHKINKEVRPEEILIAIEEQTKLAALIGEARIRMDALQLIQKGAL